jgi:hypothetical protein
MFDFLLELIAGSLGGDGSDLVEKIRSKQAIKRFARQGYIQVTGAVQAGGYLRSGYLRIDPAGMRLSLDPQGKFRPARWEFADFTTYSLHLNSDAGNPTPMTVAAPMSSVLHLVGPDSDMLVAFDGANDAIISQVLGAAGLRHGEASGGAAPESS